MVAVLLQVVLQVQVVLVVLAGEEAVAEVLQDGIVAHLIKAMQEVLFIIVEAEEAEELDLR
jgi:hypothetical protein